MVEVIENLLQRYGTLATVLAIITGIGGVLWWVADQAHRIKINESEIHEIRAELFGGRQDINPLLQRVTALETQQAYLTAAAVRYQGILERMTDRMNIIDHRLAETSINVTANQEIARKILEQQVVITAIITDIKRTLPGNSK